MSAARDIASVVLSELPVALARQRDPSLRGRPVAVARGGTVIAASSEAGEGGVAPGSPAGRVGKGVTVIPFEPAVVQRARRAVGEALSRYTPRVEAESTGIWYLDLTGAGQGRSRVPADLAEKAVRRLDADLGLPARAGLASGKAVARMAAANGEEPVIPVPAGGEAAHLRGYPVAALPGLGREQWLRLRRLGLDRLGAVAALPAERLEAVFGLRGRWWSQWSRGVDPRPVTAWAGAAEDERDWRLSLPLSSSEQSPAAAGPGLFGAAERLGRQLRERTEQAVRLQLLLTYRDGAERAHTARLEPTDRDFDLYEACHGLLAAAWTRRVGARRVAVAVTERARGGQGELFPGGASADRLLESIDAVRDRFGPEALHWGRRWGEAP